MTTKHLTAARPRGRDYILPAIAAFACAGAAYAGADTTFDPALQKFTVCRRTQSRRHPVRVGSPARGAARIAIATA